jgi:actin-related protein
MKCKAGRYYRKKNVFLFLIVLITIVSVTGFKSKRKEKTDNEKITNTKSLKNSNKIRNIEKSSVVDTAKASTNTDRLRDKDISPPTGTKQKQLNIENTKKKNSQKLSIDSKTFHYLSAFDRKNPLYTEDSKRLDFKFRRNYYKKSKNQNINQN